jgi:signal transduction histidine kinase
MTALTSLEPLLQVVGLIATASLFLFSYSFPQDRYVPRWTGWLALVVVLWQIPDTFFRDSPMSTYSWPAPINAAVWVILALSVIFVQVYRYRRVSSSAERQQTRWVVGGIALSALSFAAVVIFIALVGREPDSVVALAVGGTAYYVALLPLPLSIAVAMLDDRRWGIDVLIGRGLVYVGLTAGVIGLYAVIVVGIGQFVQIGNLPLSLIATGLVAIVFQPMRLWLQRDVGRLLYGERDDPYRVLARLGRRLDESIEPDAVLPTIVRTVADALKLHDVAIAVGHGEVVSAVGEAPRDPLRLPLTHRGEAVGELIVGLRPGERSFSDAERILLEDLARQAGAATHAVRLTAELRRSREEIVMAREEERRRLRRDLHDGLGPSLASVTLMADAARNVLPSDPARADALLAELKAEARSATSEVRRVVYELRPAALDELGLVGALREQAAQYAHAGTEVTVEAHELGELPAAVEVAAYRIASEGMTNAMRHAAASHCTVTLRRSRELKVVVADDGRGLGSSRAGVGMTSMRQRAEELGGSCVVSSDARGTTVRATLPLAGRTPR